MAVKETLAVIRADTATEAVEPYSVAWWESRTAEELRDIINRGFAGGQAFQAAVAEAERRSREETKRLRALAALQAERRNKRNRIIMGIVGAVAAIAVLGMWIFA